jgi:hypothetical protein
MDMGGWHVVIPGAALQQGQHRLQEQLHKALGSGCRGSMCRVVARSRRAVGGGRDGNSMDRWGHGRSMVWPQNKGVYQVCIAGAPTRGTGANRIQSNELLLCPCPCQPEARISPVQGAGPDKEVSGRIQLAPDPAGAGGRPTNHHARSLSLSQSGRAAAAASRGSVSVGQPMQVE